MAENFYTILTSIGKSKLANSTVLGSKVNLKTLQVGDGNGAYHEPSEDQTSLINKIWESDISSISVDEANSNWIVIQTIIPATDGGFYIREAGIFDEEGDLIAVSKVSETYKPVISEGSAKDISISIVLEISNVDNITLKIDPNVVVATKNDIEVLESEIENFNTQLSEKADKDLTLQTNLNSDKIDGYDAGNASGNIPVSNGKLNTNLNADKVDGYDVGTNAGTIPYYDSNGNLPSNELITKGLHSGNLLFNASFKLGKAGWAGFDLSGFNLVNGGNGEGQYVSNATSNSGVCIYSTTKISISAGLNITLSSEMFAGGTKTGNVSTQIIFLASDASTETGNRSVFAANGVGWTRYSTTIVTPANTCYAYVRCVLDGTVSNTNAAWRRIKVEYNSHATAFSDDCVVDTFRYGPYMPLIQSMGNVTGLKIQTGSGSATVSTASSGVYVSVSFPTTFSSTPLVYATPATANAGGNYYYTLMAQSATTTGFTLYFNCGTPTTVWFNWIAIGS